MSSKFMRTLFGLFGVAILLISACVPAKKAENSHVGGDALTWDVWDGYTNFLDLVSREAPDVTLCFQSYGGANHTGYSWAQMRGDDISDIFITSQILDEELAKERLADLSGYDFINSLPTAVLDQVAIDGGIYLLPVNCAMYGIFYNKTLMEEHGWETPTNFAELEALCEEIREAGLIPGVIGTQLTGNTFSTVFNLAKTDWLTTPEGLGWERSFLEGKATAASAWEDTMAYVQRYADIGMLTTDPEDRGNPAIILDYLGNRKSVFATAVITLNITQLPGTGDRLGMMPFISEDGSKNIYMYSPTGYIGISKRLMEPGNKQKLEDALTLLALLYSPEGQASFITEQTPCVLSILDGAAVSEDSLIYDAQQALWQGRGFPMTYVGWENILSDIGQAYKDWFRGVDGVGADTCIARMDELQQHYLHETDQIYFCESTADFTLEETGELLGKALGSTVGADVAMIPLGAYHESGAKLLSGATAKLYAGKIDIEISNTICPGIDGEYALMTMTGSQIEKVARSGLDTGDGEPFSYLLVTKGDRELESDQVYQVAFPARAYTEEVGGTYNAQVYEGSLRIFLRDWLRRQKTVSPDGNPWD